MTVSTPPEQRRTPKTTASPSRTRDAEAEAWAWTRRRKQLPFHFFECPHGMSDAARVACCSALEQHAVMLCAPRAGDGEGEGDLHLELACRGAAGSAGNSSTRASACGTCCAISRRAPYPSWATASTTARGSRARRCRCASALPNVRDEAAVRAQPQGVDLGAERPQPDP